MSGLSNTLITNVINILFNTLWIFYLVPKTRYGKKKTALVMGICFVTLLAVALALSRWARATGAWTEDGPYRVGTVSMLFMITSISFGLVFVFAVSPLHPAMSLYLWAMYGCIWMVIYITVSMFTSMVPALHNYVSVWALRVGLNSLLLVLYLVFLRDPLYRRCKRMNRWYWLAAAMACFSLFLVMVQMYYHETMQVANAVEWVMLILSVCLIASVHVTIFWFVVQQDQRARLEWMEEQGYLMQAQIESYEKLEEKARQTRHDFRHHNMIVLEYARQGDCQSILDYLQEYEDREAAKYTRTYCANHAVDTLLAVYSERCQKENIRLHIDARLGKAENITDFDMVSILANVLENAVNGCKMLAENRNIEVNLYQKQMKLSLICQNTCVQETAFEDGLPQSFRRAGIGMESITSCAAKYRGDVDFSTWDGVFTCRVMLNDLPPTIKEGS